MIIVHKRVDGKIWVTRPAFPMTLEQLIREAEIIHAREPEMGTWMIKDESELPVDRLFRDNWIADNEFNVTVDMVKARAWFKEHLQDCRVDKLNRKKISRSESDAVDTVIRGLNAQIDAAQNTDQLKALKPNILK